MSSRLSAVSGLFLAAMLAACGSGGGSGGDPATPAPSPTPDPGSTTTRAGVIQDTSGQLVNLVTDVGSVLPQPVDDLLISVSQILPTGFQRGVIRLMGNNVQLVAGTAAFDASFSHNGSNRRFVVIRPEPVAAAAAPVLLMFHGNGGTAENQANLSEVAKLVAATGVWAVMPDSLDGTWDDDPARPKGRDDVGFVGRVLDALGTSFPVNLQRVYAAGLSNGSFMASRLACEMSGRIGGFGIVAGTITNGVAAVCAPTQPRPIMLIAGTSDPIVPYNGGRIGLRSAPAAFAFWQGIHGCNEADTLVSEMPDLATDDGTTIELRANSRCASGGEVRLYTVRNGGHAWPGGWQYLPISSIGRTSRDVIATREIWDFLSQP